MTSSLSILKHSWIPSLPSWSASDHAYMREALMLAQAAVGLASPNPCVGAVLVRDGKVVGRGMHTYEGVKHAEVLALEDAGAAARGATLYINLEPCSHRGRTGPCADAVIAAGITRIVAAIEDPNPAVAGQGFARLRAAGVQVEIGPFEEEARRLNESFAKWIRTGMPFVHLKAGMSLDAKIAPTSGSGASPWITSEVSRLHAQALRHAADAILVGIGTALADDPSLTDRTGLPRRRPLLRVVLDRQLRLPISSRLVQTAREDLLVVCSHASRESGRTQALRERGAEVLGIDETAGAAFWQQLLQALALRNVTSILLEGGAHVYGSAISAAVVDKLSLYIAPAILGDGALLAFGEVTRHTVLQYCQTQRLGDDLLVSGYICDPFATERA